MTAKRKRISARTLDLLVQYSRLWDLDPTTSILRLEASEDTRPYFVIITVEPKGFLVSMLKDPHNRKDSYVEVLIKPDNPLYTLVAHRTVALDVAGVGTEVEGVGEAFDTGVYRAVVTREEHDKLLAAV